MSGCIGGWMCGGGEMVDEWMYRWMDVWGW